MGQSNKENPLISVAKVMGAMALVWFALEPALKPLLAKAWAAVNNADPAHHPDDDNVADAKGNSKGKQPATDEHSEDAAAEDVASTSNSD